MANAADSSTTLNAAMTAKPVRGILKNTSSFDKDGHAVEKPPAEKEMKWDEMNILATYHPPDKDYGHIKIDEPPTPYNKLSEGEMEEGRSGDEGETGLNPEALADSLKKKTKPKIMTEIEDSPDEDEDENLTEEERARRRAFAKRRKLHYNEFYAVKLARQLLDEEDDEDPDEVKTLQPPTEGDRKESDVVEDRNATEKPKNDD